MRSFSACRMLQGTVNLKAHAMIPIMSVLSLQDQQVRLWDLRSTQCQGLVTCPGPATAAFDQQGLVFCIGSDSGVIKLYDVRSYDKGPFDTFTVGFSARQPPARPHEYRQPWHRRYRRL